MKRIPVVSSSITTIAYVLDTNLLEVEFRHGASYQYFAVPSATFDAFLVANSKGAYFNQHIKGRYPFRRIDT